MSANTELKTQMSSNDETDCENLDKRLESIHLFNSGDKCESWLENCTSDEVLSVSSELTETSDGSLYTHLTDNNDMTYLFEDVVIQSKDGENLPVRLINSESSKYDNVNIYKSRKVHVGDVTVVYGPIFVKRTKKENQSNMETNTFYSSLGVISRTNWLAQPPVSEKEYLDGPAKFVIICHTATEEGFSQAENTLHVRLIQTFHIESRKWSDVSYNFLIGSDGLIYEGRGWTVKGAHSLNYNANSVGISFIGCFLKHLPPRVSLEKAKALIEYGVKNGYIAKDYRLLAHRQCKCIESPGQRLFEEIQTWDRWDSSVRVVESILEKESDRTS